MNGGAKFPCVKSIFITPLRLLQKGLHRRTHLVVTDLPPLRRVVLVEHRQRLVPQGNLLALSSILLSKTQ